jgi:hypothetical protein
LGRSDGWAIFGLFISDAADLLKELYDKGTTDFVAVVPLLLALLWVERFPVGAGMGVGYQSRLSYFQAFYSSSAVYNQLAAGLTRWEC